MIFFCPSMPDLRPGGVHLWPDDAPDLRHDA